MGDQTRSTHVLCHDFANLPFHISTGVVRVSANTRFNVLRVLCAEHTHETAVHASGL